MILENQDRRRRAGSACPACPRARGTTLIVVPNDDQPYLMQRIRCARPAGRRARCRSSWRCTGESGSRARSPSKRPGSRCPRHGCITCRFWRIRSPRRTRSSTRTATRMGRLPGPLPDQARRHVPAGRAAGTGDRRGGGPRQDVPPGRRRRSNQWHEQAWSLRDLSQPDQPREALAHGDERNQSARGCEGRPARPPGQTGPSVRFMVVDPDGKPDHRDFKPRTVRAGARARKTT